MRGQQRQKKGKREAICVWMRVHEREWENTNKQQERAAKRERESACVWACKSVCVCVCMRGRAKVRGQTKQKQDKSERGCEGLVNLFSLQPVPCQLPGEAVLVGGEHAQRGTTNCLGVCPLLPVEKELA